MPREEVGIVHNATYKIIIIIEKLGLNNFNVNCTPFFYIKFNVNVSTKRNLG